MSFVIISGIILKQLVGHLRGEQIFFLKKSSGKNRPVGKSENEILDALNKYA